MKPQLTPYTLDAFSIGRGLGNLKFNFQLFLHGEWLQSVAMQHVSREVDPIVEIALQFELAANTERCELEFLADIVV
ncbi:MAG: hypothetical protein NWE80_01810 [Candidatus Bathyarchaeota archaeon]|nr:hypothetical protein [Candidatus Bathyarchaeota archaeon]